MEIGSRLTHFCVQTIENMASPERAILFLIYFWSMRIDDVCVHADEAANPSKLVLYP